MNATKEDIIKIEKLMDDLGENEDVQEIFVNIKDEIEQ